jgi:hypothetical protein
VKKEITEMNDMEGFDATMGVALKIISMIDGMLTEEILFALTVVMVKVCVATGADLDLMQQAMSKMYKELSNMGENQIH